MIPQHIITCGTRKDCVRLRGLPYEAVVEHILDFMGEHSKNIVFQGVHMVYNAQVRISRVRHATIRSFLLLVCISPFLALFRQGQPSGEAFIQMDSEASAYACASQRHHRYMIFGKKQRYIEVFQCSGDDMSLVLTGAVTPPSTTPLPSPGTLTTQTPATLTHPPAPVPVAVPAAQPPPPQLWDIHTLMQAQVAQAQVAQAQAAQAQVAQAQVAQAAIRNPDFWLMALASNPPPTSTTPASPTSTSKSLALAAPSPAQAQIPAYAVSPPTAAAVAAAALHHHHAAVAQPPAPAAPFLLFNPLPPRIPILRAPTPHGLLPPAIMQTTPLNPAALMGLKRTWESAFPADAASSVAKRAATWHHAPSAAAFHATAPTAAPALPYPSQFYPQI